MHRGQLVRRAVPLLMLGGLALAGVTAGSSARPTLLAAELPPTVGAPRAQLLPPGHLEPAPGHLESAAAGQMVPASAGQVEQPKPLAGRPQSAAPLSPMAGPPPVIAGARSRVPVLMYHVLGEGDNSLFVSVADFHAQMDWLEQNGYHTVSLPQLYRNQTRGEPLPDKPVVLTFDDGYESFYSIGYPAFRRHHFTAVLFAVPGFFGRSGFVTAQQVQEMDRGGMEIESHTLHHVDLPSQSGDALAREVLDSRRALNTLLSHPVQFFCYPSGSYNSRVITAVREAGYLAALTTHYGPVTPGSDPYQWRRIRISRGQTLEGFAQQVRGASE